MMTTEQRSAMWRVCPEPVDYYTGLRTPYACPVDNLLGFVRRLGRTLTQNPGHEHLHHRWIWTYAQSGRAVNVVNGRRLPLSPGEMILIPGYAPHYHQADPQISLEWFFLTFECDNVLWRTRLGERVLRPLGEELELFDEASRLMIEGKAAEASLTLSLFHEALLRKTPHHGSPEDRWLMRIQQWASQIEGAPTVGALAREIGGSESHLRAQFREKTGLSLGGYLLHLRMVQAVEDLHDSRLSVTEVAYRAGYANPGNFSRAFAREMGMSPRAYREVHLR